MRKFWAKRGRTTHDIAPMQDGTSITDQNIVIIDSAPLKTEDASSECAIGKIDESTVVAKIAESQNAGSANRWDGHLISGRRNMPRVSLCFGNTREFHLHACSLQPCRSEIRTQNQVKLDTVSLPIVLANPSSSKSSKRQTASY